ncbi:MAG: class I SAM-dependent methyltransferase [Planctomycetales bacterium]|nr:class I SAM-dependent methyltransferase [Planctomycetales bacterium]
MISITPLPTPATPASDATAAAATGPAYAVPREVMLADGTFAQLASLTAEELAQLQFEQEQKFAQAILAFPARSQERGMVVGQAYDTVCGILAALRAAEGHGDQPLVMGFDERYARLVLKLLQKQIAHGIGQPRLFEIGFGSAALLKEIRGHGFSVGGIEVSTTMRDQAAVELGPRYAPDLLLGDFREIAADDLPGAPTVVFWNDVLEHLAPDEAQEFVDHAYRLLKPGGALVTITPNWLLRPSDVTCCFHPPRTTACGLHLKEYRLAEVSRLLKRAGFRRVATPAFATHGQLVMFGGGFRRTKQLLEPALDRAPLKLARLLCRGWAMSCTVATK